MPDQSKDLLLIFTRNPELGKCKTRLAASVGDQTALDIYTFLLEYTVSITENLAVDKQVHYSVKIRENDLWKYPYFSKKQQEGADLGLRMKYAFEQGFAVGYERIVIIGSDMYDMNQQDLEDAFLALKKNDFVIGPAEDGGYYLLGMTHMKPDVFQNKNWGTETVFSETMKDLEKETTKQLITKNDIDYVEDLNGFPVFDKFLINYKP